MAKLFHKEEVVGKTVVDSLGEVRGKVKDLVFSLDENVALIIESTEGSEVRVPLSKVTGISDYVVVRTDVAPEPSMAPVMQVGPLGSGTPYSGVGSSSANCKFCGTPMSPDTTYCPGCGRSRV
jgi:sporulation protein YlmC with PRC-barrel domain